MREQPQKCATLCENYLFFEGLTDVPISREQMAELDRRMEAYRRDPSQVTSWDALQQRILGRSFGRD